jgi:hypothetical protein
MAAPPKNAKQVEKNWKMIGRTSSKHHRGNTLRHFLLIIFWGLLYPSCVIKRYVLKNPPVQ